MLRYSILSRGTSLPPGLQRRAWAVPCRAAVPLSQEAGATLSSWLKDKHGFDDDCGLEVKYLGPSLGYAAVAKRPIATGNVIVRVPRTAIITVRDARRLPHAKGLSDWQALLWALLWESALGSQSEFAPYLAAIPSEETVTAELSHPLLWPEDVSEAVLSGSPMLATLRERVAICDEDYRVLSSTAASSAAVHLTPQRVRWAAAMLLSRAFYLERTDDEDNEVDEDEEQGGEGGLALVPWADSLNHSGAAGEPSCLRYDPSLRAACLRAHRDYSPGDEVFDSYGPQRAPSELFIDYGFVDADSAAHRARLPAAALGPVAEAPAELLRSASLPPEAATADFAPEGPGESVLAWARAACASAEELAAAGWSGTGGGGGAAAYRAASRAMAHFSRRVSAENERKARGRLVRACREQLAALKAGRQRAGREGALMRTGACGQAALRALESERLALEGSVQVLERL